MISIDDLRFFGKPINHIILNTDRYNKKSGTKGILTAFLEYRDLFAVMFENNDWITIKPFSDIKYFDSSRSLFD